MALGTLSVLGAFQHRRPHFCPSIPKACSSTRTFGTNACLLPLCEPHTTSNRNPRTCHNIHNSIALMIFSRAAGAQVRLLVALFASITASAEVLSFLEFSSFARVLLLLLSFFSLFSVALTCSLRLLTSTLPFCPPGFRWRVQPGAIVGAELRVSCLTGGSCAIAFALHCSSIDNDILARLASLLHSNPSESSRRRPERRSARRCSSELRRFGNHLGFVVPSVGI